MPQTSDNVLLILDFQVGIGDQPYARRAVATVLWKNAILASMQRIWIHRMSVVLIREGADWRVLLMHVTAIQPISRLLTEY